MALQDTEGRRRDVLSMVDITVDSGAAKAVAQPTVAPMYKVGPTPGSTGGHKYRTSSQNVLVHQGEKNITMNTEGGDTSIMPFQIAGVTKPLALAGSARCRGQGRLG